jgi:hypothetical protein
MESLGYAAHIVMDSTMLQHATDCGDENSPCGHRRYEGYLERRYDDWELLHGSDEEVLSVAEIQELATDEASALVKRGAGEAHQLIDLVKDGASNSKMEQAVRYLLPLAQQLVATLVLRFVADLPNSFFHEEAVMLQITSIEVDGVSSGKKTPADFRPVVRFGDRRENRGYVANSNFVYMETPINSHAWTFVQRVDRKTFLLMIEPVVSFQLEIHDAIVADKCGDDRGDTQKRMVIASEDRKTIQVSLPLNVQSQDEVLFGSSTGCDVVRLDRNECRNAVKVSWKIGRSFLMNGYMDPLKQNSLSFSEFVTPKGLNTIIFSFLSFFILFRGLIYWTYWCYRRRRRKESERLGKLEAGMGETIDIEHAYLVDEDDHFPLQAPLRRHTQVMWPLPAFVDDDDDEDDDIGVDEKRDVFVSNGNLDGQKEGALASFPLMATSNEGETLNGSGRARRRRQSIFSEASRKSSFESSVSSGMMARHLESGRTTPTSTERPSSGSSSVFTNRNEQNMSMERLSSRSSSVLTNRNEQTSDPFFGFGSLARSQPLVEKLYADQDDNQHALNQPEILQERSFLAQEEYPPPPVLAQINPSWNEDTRHINKLVTETT